MKKFLILLITVICGFTAANAQEESRLLISAGQFKNIVLGEGMKVVLVSDGSLQTEIKGDMGFFEKVNVSVADGSLHVRAGSRLGGETVFIAVNQLKQLTVGQRTHVTTEGVLRSSEIKVFVYEGSVARLKTTGEVNAFSPDGEFSVMKIEKPLAVAFLP
jgi:hypothetical protein